MITCTQDMKAQKTCMSHACALSPFSAHFPPLITSYYQSMHQTLVYPVLPPLLTFIVPTRVRGILDSRQKLLKLWVEGDSESAVNNPAVYLHRGNTNGTQWI